MQEIINEKVGVVTVFRRYKARNQVLPWHIRWQGKTYTITDVAFHHKVKEGTKLIHIFSVTDGTMDFRLRFDTDTLHWTLEEVSDGLAS